MPLSVFVLQLFLEIIPKKITKDLVDIIGGIFKRLLSHEYKHIQSGLLVMVQFSSHLQCADDD